MTTSKLSPRKLTGALAAVGLALAMAAALWLALRTWPAATATACTFGRPAPPGAITFAPTAAPPTEAPAATASAAPTEVLTTADIDFATQYAAAATAVIVRATQSPFATAQPVVARSVAGQPGLLVARRGGLTLQVRLPTDAYLNGEAAQAEATLRNEGAETLFVEGDFSPFGTTLLDAQGHEPSPWPWPPLSFPGFPHLDALAPGQSVTATVLFHVAGPAPVYALWVETRFSRAMPLDNTGPDNIWLRLEAGPLPLHVQAPAPTQRLRAQLQVDRAGWALRITGANGQPPAGPLVGLLEVASANSSGTRPLASRPDGTWSSSWGDQDFGPGPFMVRAWVAAPGYVSAVVTQTVAGSGGMAPFLFGGSAPDQRTYATLVAAQAALGIPLYRLANPPAGNALDAIQTEASASSDDCSITTRQLYHLPPGGWLELAQFYYNPPDANGNWGAARYDSEAQTLSVAGQPAYLMQRLGWWTLDWQMGNDGLELRAPVGAFSAADLLALAGRVRR